MVDKYGQWRAQAKYPGLVAELGKCYHVALKLKANNAISNVTIKYQDNAEMIYVTDAALEANVEYVFDQTVAGANQESGAPGNGIMVLDFGFSHAGDIIEIYDVVIEEVECPQPTHTYTVAGSSAALFGESWAPAKVENDMIKQEDGTYKWENSEVELGAGDVEFKVVIDHDWANGSYPEQNYILNIAEDGIYTVTITYNPADNNAVNAVATKTGDAVVVKHYLVVGQPIIANGEEWNNAADINEMTSADEGATYTLTIADLQLMAGTKYRYKIVEKGEWTEYFPKHEDNSDTCFTVPTDGVYTITYVYTVATELCEVQTLRTGDLPEPEHTNGYYLMGTFSGVDAWTLDDLTEAKRFLPIETTAEGTRYALEVSLAAGDSIKFVNVVQDAIVLWMPEGTNKGFVIDANHAGEKTIYLTVYTNGDWFYYIEQNLPDGYYLLGSMNNWTAAAEYRFVPAETAGEYILNATVEAGDEIKVAYVVNAHATEWYPGEGEPNYLVDVAHAGTKDIYFRTEYNLDWYEFGGYFWMGDNGGATSIDNTAADAKAVKMIKNGMILIIKGDKTYNIMGQIVK